MSKDVDIRIPTQKSHHYADSSQTALSVSCIASDFLEEIHHSGEDHQQNTSTRT